MTGRVRRVLINQETLDNSGALTGTFVDKQLNKSGLCGILRGIDVLRINAMVNLEDIVCILYYSMLSVTGQVIANVIKLPLHYY